MVNDCEDKFAAFSHEVYSREGIVTDDKKYSITFDFMTKHRQKKSYKRAELISRLQEIVNNLNDNTLEIGDKKVNPLSDQTVLEWDYKESKDSNALEIKISWPPASAERKDIQ
jgi:hypothetical protein